MMFIAAAVAAATVPSAQETVQYTVRRGDTLEGLARDYLLPNVHWRELQRLAKVRDPRHLPINRQLAIPRRWLRYRTETARLASFRGTISARAGVRTIPAAVGTLVSEGTELATGANSFLTLILSDGSKLVVPSQSRIRLGAVRRIILTGAIDYQVQVLDGRIETKVSPLTKPADRYRIGTPVSMTAVRGTEFRVRFRPENAIAATEVLDGRVALADASGEREEIIPQSFGSIVDRAGQQQMIRLLDAPELLEPGRLQADEPVRFQARSASDAASYRVVIAADAGFIENLAEQVSADGKFSVPDIPNGTLFVRVSALDANGLEGLAQSYSFRRVLASLRTEVGREDDGFRFRWSGAGEGIRRYRFQLFSGDPDSVPIVDESGMARNSLFVRNLAPGIYHWRIGLTQYGQMGDVENWSDFEKLTITSSEAD